MTHYESLGNHNFGSPLSKRTRLQSTQIFKRNTDWSCIFCHRFSISISAQSQSICSMADRKRKYKPRCDLVPWNVKMNLRLRQLGLLCTYYMPTACVCLCVCVCVCVCVCATRFPCKEQFNLAYQTHTARIQLPRQARRAGPLLDKSWINAQV